jgi:NAD-dependent deacetylase
VNLLILTGAGISAESGVSTFRDKDGIWSKHDWREVATPEGFAADPRRVHEFYNQRRARLQTVHPNAAHRALAELEARLAARGGRLTLVTQNVDDLHERAGSKRVIHMHGELLKARCTACGAIHAWRAALSVEVECPACRGAGALRPDVVWFGEIPMRMEEIGAALAEADLFAAIGTSGAVYPAAGLAADARARAIPCVELNLEPSENAFLFSDRRYGRAGDIVPAWAAEIA